ncbi:MAG TPA: hypothetical protein PK141_02460 [Polyangiaceae bacterium]|nr:hypothetical protein [Polyangiaceae bacterium]
MRTTLKIQGLTIVESTGGPVHVEYALFDPEDRELGRSGGRVVEVGFRTTARAARARFAQLGLSAELAASVAEGMMSGLAQAFARGGPARRVVGLLEPAVLFESTRYDPVAAVYPGTFLDLEALEKEVAREGVTATFQALALAAQLARLDDGARIELDTLEYAASQKPGTNTFTRVALHALPDLPGLLGELAGRGGGRGARGTPVGQGKLTELLRARLHGGPRFDACVKAIDAVRAAPTAGSLASAGLWEIELLLDAGNFAAAAQKLLVVERKTGRTPVTTYLRARHELLTGVGAEALARRLVSAANGAGAFPELLLLASEAALASADEGRARDLARRALDERSLPALLRERAVMVLQRCGSAPPFELAPHTVYARADGPRAEASPRARRAMVDPRAEDDSPPTPAPVARPPERPRPPSVLPPPQRFITPASDLEIDRAPPSRPALPPSPLDSAFYGGPPPGASSPAAPSPDRTPVRPLTLSLPELAIPSRPSSEHDVATARPINFIDQFSPQAAPPPDAAAPLRSSPPPPVLTVPAGAQAPAAKTGETPHGLRVPPAAESERPPRDDGELPGSLPPPPPAASRPPRVIDSRHPTAAPASSAMPPLPADATGASLPLSTREEAPPWFGRAPALPGGDPRGAEAAEELPLPLPAGLSGATLVAELPRTVLEARLQFTFLSRELGRLYRGARLITLRADLSGIEHMQSYLGERFASGELDAAGLAEVRLHGAFLSEIIARRLGGEWIDIRAPHLGHWEMMVAPGTHIWPFARVARYVARGQRERDLVAYFLELQTHALLASRG